MAIAKIKKLELIGLKQDKEKILALLQRLGAVQLINVKDQQAQISLSAVSSETNLSEIEEAISFLASFKEKTGFLASMVKFKPLVYQQQLQDVIAEFDYRNLLNELSGLRNHFKNILQHKQRLIQERQLLSPWRNLGISLEELYYKNHCGIILGTLSRRDYLSLKEDLEKDKINFFLEEVYQDTANMYLAIIYLQKEFQRLELILKNFHFNFVTFPPRADQPMAETQHKCKARERLFAINSEITLLDEQLEELKNKIIKLSEHQFKLMLIYDYLYNIRQTQEAEENLVKQQFTFGLSGWIKAKDEDKLKQEVALRFPDVAMFISEPQKDEVVPVVLENKPIIQPFEFVTSIYGMPKYSEVDPTPFLAPFFFLYFGFCVSDVGYGLMLMMVSWLALKKFRLGAQGSRFFRLFLFCGVSTVIIGMLTGSWFGNLFDLLAQSNKLFLPLKRFKDSVVILDPLQEPTKLLGIALGFGIIQVWFGNVVAAIGNIKNKRYLNVIFDQLSMFIFLFGLTGLGLIFLDLLNKAYIGLFKYSATLGAIALILTQGRSEKGIVAKLFYGMYNLYSALSGYLSDILSYSRLWALGLVTGVMANTINLISIEFSKILLVTMPFLNRIALVRIIVSGLILVIIFIAGHIVSFLMNLLGAFVHPLRLQFVEFFSKFFKSSGSSFKPFRLETKYIDLS